jgi:cyclophilin family peptidyl-prolyl cis-trans isomerase
VPTEKRARQRALRDQKYAVVERSMRQRRRLRRAGSFVVVGGVVVALIFLLSSHSPAKKAATTTTTTTTATTTTIPTTTTAATDAIAPACPPAAGSAKRETAFTKAPALCISATATYAATVKTDVGTFVITMPAAKSLLAVNNFVFLSRYHFYDSTIFHRVIPSFVVQGGDPTGTGSGGPGYQFTGNTPPTKCQPNCYPLGSVALANSSSSPKTDESQFFVTVGASGVQLPPEYTLFGTVTSGMAVVDKIAKDGTAAGTPKVTHHIISVTIREVSA